MKRETILKNTPGHEYFHPDGTVYIPKEMALQAMKTYGDEILPPVNEGQQQPETFESYLAANYDKCSIADYYMRKDCNYPLIRLGTILEEFAAISGQQQPVQGEISMSNIRVYGINSNEFEGKIFELTNNDFVHISEGQGYVWTLEGYESAFNSEEIPYDMFIRFIDPVKEEL